MRSRLTATSPSASSKERGRRASLRDVWPANYCASNSEPPAEKALPPPRACYAEPARPHERDRSEPSWSAATARRARAQREWHLPFPRVGRVQKVKDHQCKVEFNPSVFSRPPYRSENKILGLDEIEVCPTPLELGEGRPVGRSLEIRPSPDGGALPHAQQGRPAFKRPNGNPAPPDLHRLHRGLKPATALYAGGRSGPGENH